MADDFQLGSGNWWEASRGRFDSETTSASIPTTLSAMGSSFVWPTEMGDMKPRPSMDSGGSMVLHGGADQSPTGGVLAEHGNLQMMGLGLPSQGLDWSQALFRDEKGESSFRSVIQDDLSSNTGSFQQVAAESSSQDHWTQKLYSGTASPDDSSVHDFRQMNRGFSLDKPQFSSQGSSTNGTAITSAHSLTTSFQLDSAAYGLLLPENSPHHSNYETPRGTTMNFPYPTPNAAGLIPTWNKFPQAFLRTSPPKQPPPPPPSGSGTHLHFTNNTPFWNASAPAGADARSSFFPDIQTQIPSASSFDEKPKSSSETRDLTTTKKATTETSNKRPRNEAPSPLPAFKVRKEKMGDRITALQQLVSPFGKTDTASVLSEAIEYIKFLHEQVSVLSTPYMKNGAPIQQNPDKSNKDPAEGPRQDLRSRGLCLVPVSSTFPMTHETTVEFWTPSFGGSFR